MNAYRKPRSSMLLFRMHASVLIGVLMLAGLSEPTAAYVAVSLDSGGGGWPAAGSNHGWQFTVNQPIEVTHLGLYDLGDNGFVIAHPIGLWRLSDEMLLASGTISAGTVNPLLNHFRYIEIPSVPLTVGEDYVIGYYSASGSTDWVITSAINVQVDPAITLVAARWGNRGEFKIPANITIYDRFGPNFQFVPELGTVLLIGLGGLALLRKRRK